MRNYHSQRLLSWICSVITGVFTLALNGAPAAANRLVYLDENDPFYVHLGFPKLTTPQWVGEPGVEAVVILAIDDLREPKKYETVLRPILERLKQIDGRAPVSIFCNTLDPQQAQFQAWLEEGLSLEVHTLTHPCPLLAKGNFQAAADVVHNGLELMNRIPNNNSVAFRMPCCDSINSPSPRFFAEIFNRTNAAGQFLTMDSSVMNIPTWKDPALQKEWVTDGDGREKFRKYLPFPSFVTTVEDYPYPYVIGKLCWEFPAMVPSDWEAQHIQGTNNPVTVADWKAALDATVLKQGAFTFIFHPHGWIRPNQMVEFIDYAVQKYGKKVKFLNFREAQERLDKHLLAGQPLRAANGQDNGARLVDLDNDGYLDVLIGNERVQKTRLWNPKRNAWTESELPAPLVALDQQSQRRDNGVKFGVVRSNGNATMLVANERMRGAWHFENGQWVQDKSLLTGLELDNQPVLTSRNQIDRGVRLRDVDNNGTCELIVGNDSQNAVYRWMPDEQSWKKLAYALPKGASIVDASGQDNGLRFADINTDGYDDVVFSNEQSYSLNLYVPKLYLGFQAGWTRDVITGKRGEPGEIPMIVRGGTIRNNGAWFHSRHLWVQNEDTATLKDLVDRRSYEELLGGLKPSGKSPKASLESIRVRPGFKVELVAAEPLVTDPIAFDWGADGKLWVVEMGDYPLGVDGTGKPGGIVRFLEDTDGDGLYDKSTVFLEGLNFPSGVMPWRKGVLVSAAPEIFYAEDTDGDGKADVRKTLFDGFREGNQQHRVNGFDYGLDNWIYGANGDSGGEVRAVGTTSGRALAGTGTSNSRINIRGHDIRFRPDDGLFETVEGQTQYGRHRDDWGNWFGNNNPAWLWHYYLPEKYLARNPNLAVKSLKQYQANYPNSSRVHAISRTIQRFNDIAMVNHVTSGNSATPYRDDLFGPEFATSVFISEPVHNVVHREVLEPDGVTFTSHRPSDEQDREFLASTDNWFRPITLKTGPDGALYIADMYRFVLEHPEWIPPDTQRSLDLRAGHDQGRIYRVYPVSAVLRKVPRLDRLDTAGLVAALDSPNGWQRDTAQRLLVHSGDQSAAPLLEKLIQQTSNPKARLQALGTLDGLGALTPSFLASVLNDSHPSIREHAVRSCESFLRPEGTEAARSASPASRAVGRPGEKGALEAALLKVGDDPSLRVRYQCAFTLGEWNDPRAGEGLVKLAIRDADNPQMQIAILSSASRHARTMLESAVTARFGQVPASLLEQLLSLAIQMNDDSALVKPLRALTNPGDGPLDAWRLGAVAGFLDGVERRDGSLAVFQQKASPELKQALQELERPLVRAREMALNANATEADRLAVVRLLGRGATGQTEDIDGLSALLQPQISPSLQRAALANLARTKGARSAEILLLGWKSYGPGTRTEVLNILLSRPEWIGKLLEALESGQVAAAQIGPVHQQKLLGQGQAAVRQRAQKLFTAQTDRKKVLKEYERVPELSGDATKGAALFRQHCAICHRFRGEGTDIGPDLGALSSKSPQVLLAAILDPNQAVEARYVSYTAVTVSGRELSGIIASETPNSLSLRMANGAEETILRSDLKTLTSSGLSAMPEGLENALNPQALADLIQYLVAAPGL
jgi:putative membrane-bound dehydrogenase-like protein